MRLVQEEEFHPFKQRHFTEARMRRRAHEFSLGQGLERRHDVRARRPQLFEKHIRRFGGPLRPLGVLFGAIGRHQRTILAPDAADPFQEHDVITRQVRKIFPCRPFVGYRPPVERLFRKTIEDDGKRFELGFETDLDGLTSLHLNSVRQRPYNIVSMSIYDERREELEKHEFMLGSERGRLAVTLDLLTDALVLVGQHGVYCQSARQPGRPAMDIQMISKCLTDAKELVADVMGQLKRKP